MCGDGAEIKALGLRGSHRARAWRMVILSSMVIRGFSFSLVLGAGRRPPHPPVGRPRALALGDSRPGGFGADKTSRRGIGRPESQPL